MFLVEYIIFLMFLLVGDLRSLPKRRSWAVLASPSPRPRVGLAKASTPFDTRASMSGGFQPGAGRGWPPLKLSLSPSEVHAWQEHHLPANRPPGAYSHRQVRRCLRRSGTCQPCARACQAPALGKAPSDQGVVLRAESLNGLCIAS